MQRIRYLTMALALALIAAIAWSPPFANATTTMPTGIEKAQAYAVPMSNQVTTSEALAVVRTQAVNPALLKMRQPANTKEQYAQAKTEKQMASTAAASYLATTKTGVTRLKGYQALTNEATIVLKSVQPGYNLSVVRTALIPYRGLHATATARSAPIANAKRILPAVNLNSGFPNPFATRPNIEAALATNTAGTMNLITATVCGDSTSAMASAVALLGTAGGQPATELAAAARFNALASSLAKTANISVRWKQAA